MNVNTIIKKIQRKLNDYTILRSDILDEINEIQTFVASFARLPALVVHKKSFPVSETTSSRKMPKDYHHNLFAVYSSTNNKPIAIHTNTTTLYSSYNETETGPLEAVCEEGLLFHMRPKLSADEDLLLSYYKKPTDLEDDTTDPETPSILPDELHEMIFVYGPLSKLLKDGDSRALAMDTFQVGVSLIKSRYPFAPKTRPNYRRDIRDL